jgi:parallel beta-helix repeat protein
MPSHASSLRPWSFTTALLLVAVVSAVLLLAPRAQARRAAAPTAAAPTQVTATASEPACTIFVSPAGKGSSSGASATVPTSLSSGLAKAQAGSVVCLEAGTYGTTTNVFLTHSGTASAPITYRNYGGTALIQYRGTAAAYPTGGVLETSSGTNWTGSHDLVIEGLKIDGGNWLGGGISVIRGSHNITIRDCVIQNTGAEGIELNAVDYVTVTDNEIYHVGYNQGWGSGISLWYGGASSTPTYGGASAWYDQRAGFHNYIVDNIVSGAYDNSSHHTDGNGIIVDGDGSIPPALIANNLVYENGGRGIEVYSTSGDVWVVNNTAYANGLDPKIAGGQAGDFFANDATSVHWVNDLAYGRQNGTTYTTAYTYFINASSVAWASSIGYDGSLLGVGAADSGTSSRYRYANPLFTAAPAIPSGSTPWASALPPWSVGGDFTLQPGSAAVDGGVDPASVAGMNSDLAAGLNGQMAVDLAGSARVQGASIDVGAYEG